MEPNGRGTGLKNAFDIDAFSMILGYCSQVMSSATDRLIQEFPDAIVVRNGIDSKFAPGPRKNLPKHLKKELQKKGQLYT